MKQIDCLDLGCKQEVKADCENRGCSSGNMIEEKRKTNVGKVAKQSTPTSKSGIYSDPIHETLALPCFSPCSEKCWWIMQECIYCLEKQNIPKCLFLSKVVIMRYSIRLPRNHHLFQGL
jgi:competence transcription factor ComK